MSLWSCGLCVAHVAGGANTVASGALSMSSCCKMFANSCSAQAGIDVRGHVGTECCVCSCVFAKANMVGQSMCFMVDKLCFGVVVLVVVVAAVVVVAVVLAIVVGIVVVCVVGVDCCRCCCCCGGGCCGWKCGIMRLLLVLSLLL